MDTPPTWTTSASTWAWPSSTCWVSRTERPSPLTTPLPTPDSVRRLVLAGGLAAFTDEMQAEADRLIAARSGEPWHAEAAAALRDEEEGNYDDMAALWVRMAPMYFGRWDERYRPSVVAGSVGSSAAPAKEFGQGVLDIRAELPRISAPTLVIAGTDDFVCGPAAAAELMRGIPDAELVMLEGAGHMMFIEQPEAFRTAVEAFLGR